jgi:hypothetical protein
MAVNVFWGKHLARARKRSELIGQGMYLLACGKDAIQPFCRAGVESEYQAEAAEDSGLTLAAVDEWLAACQCYKFAREFVRAKDQLQRVYSEAQERPVKRRYTSLPQVVETETAELARRLADEFDPAGGAAPPPEVYWLTVAGWLIKDPSYWDTNPDMMLSALYSLCRRMANKMTKDADWVQDIATTTTFSVYHQLPHITLSGPGSIQAYARTAVRRAFAKKIKKVVLKLVPLPIGFNPVAPPPDIWVIAYEECLETLKTQSPEECEAYTSYAPTPGAHSKLYNRAAKKLWDCMRKKIGLE